MSKKVGIICAVAIVAALIMIFVFKASPLITLAVLLCPLMHVFMMGSDEHKH